MVGERVLAIGREEFSELPALLLGEAGADADVLQRACIVEQAEQQRADSCALALSCASESRPPRSRNRARA